jgi:hypothetical protein
MIAEAIAAPGAHLSEGSGGLQTSADIDDAVRVAIAGCELPFDERDEIRRMQTVSDLVTVSSEADVAERLLSEPAVDPIREDPLVWLPELSGTGEDPASIDPDRETIG